MSDQVQLNIQVSDEMNRRLVAHLAMTGENMNDVIIERLTPVLYASHELSPGFTPSSSIVVDNMRFESIDERRIGDVNIGFVTIEDMSTHGNGFQPPRYKHYYGLYTNTLESLKNIMKNGSKWEHKGGRITIE